MKKLLLLLFIISSKQLTAQKSQLRYLTGTWFNVDLTNSIMTNNISNNYDSIVPRCVYIDSLKGLKIEYRFEQESEFIKISNWSKSKGQLKFKAKGKNFILIDDSLLIMSDPSRKVYYKKISNQAIIGVGIQIVLRNYFFEKHKKWNLLTCEGDEVSDSQVINISTRVMRLEKNNQVLHEYEFLDTKQYILNGEKLFGIILFKTDKNFMSSSEKVYVIKKVGRQLYLYKSGYLAYRLNPLE
jgi:hypothetical protein